MSQSRNNLYEFGKITSDVLQTDELVVTELTATTLNATTTTVATSNADSVIVTKGTVTQATSPTTGVTVNTNAGVISTFASTLAAGGTEVFSVANSKVDANSVILVNVVDYTGSAGVPIVQIDGGAGAGTFNIVVRNIHGTAALDGSLAISFLVV